MTYSEFFEAYYEGDYAESEAVHARVLAGMTPTERIAWNLLRDITDRRGWGQEWDGMDDEIHDQIFSSFVKIIDAELEK
jgi:hypothetical protein